MSVSLEHDLLEHLRVEESVTALCEEGFDPQIVSDLDIRSVAQWVIDYVSKYGKPPTRVVFDEEWSGFDEDPNPQLEVSYLLERLRQKYVRKQHREITEKLIDATDPDEFVNLIVDTSYDLWKKVSKRKHIATTDDYKVLIEKFKEEAKNPQERFSFGFEPLDLVTGGGAKKGHLSFLAARPKRYKSWIALQAYVEQRKQGKIPVFFNLELSADEMYQRLLSMVSGISYTDLIYNRNMSISRWKIINDAMEKFSKLGPAYIITPPYEDRTVDKMMMEVKRVGGESVIIDQLSYIQPKGRYNSRDEGPKEVVHSMKAAALSMEIPWYCICQINREGANLEEMATADKMGLTRAIEETCDILLGLHRTKDQASRNIIQMGIIESRHSQSEINFDVKVELTKHTKFLMYED